MYACILSILFSLLHLQFISQWHIVTHYFVLVNACKFIACRNSLHLALLIFSTRILCTLSAAFEEAWIPESTMLAWNWWSKEWCLLTVSCVTLKMLLPCRRYILWFKVPHSLVSTLFIHGHSECRKKVSPPRSKHLVASVCLFTKVSGTMLAVVVLKPCHFA